MNSFVSFQKTNTIGRTSSILFICFPEDADSVNMKTLLFALGTIISTPAFAAMDFTHCNIPWRETDKIPFYIDSSGKFVIDTDSEESGNIISKSLTDTKDQIEFEFSDYKNSVRNTYILHKKNGRPTALEIVPSKNAIKRFAKGADHLFARRIITHFNYIGDTCYESGDERDLITNPEEIWLKGKAPKYKRVIVWDEKLCNDLAGSADEYIAVMQDTLASQDNKSLQKINAAFKKRKEELAKEKKELLTLEESLSLQRGGTHPLNHMGKICVSLLLKDQIKKNTPVETPEDKEGSLDAK